MADNYFRFRYGEVAGDGTSRAEIERQELMKHQREAERREVAERQRQIEATKNQIEQARQLELARQMKQTERIVHPRNERTGGAENDRTVGPKVLQIDTEQWRKYHTAWTNYYNDYYKNYYAKQANEMAASRVSANQARALPAGAVDVKRSNDNAGDDELRPVKNTLRARFMAKARCKIRESVRDTAKKAAKKSIFWPIMIGVATMLIVGFLQFNRVLIGTVKAYISPNAGAEASMVEIDPTVTTAVGEETVLIIPKINVEVPIVLGVGSDNASQQEGMKHGVTHFAIPGANALPGELGNFVVSGHSSNDVFERGEYKFIFAQLERLSAGDTIYVNYNGTRYTYAVTRLETVNPDQADKLIYPFERPMLTLVTCTPVGTAKYRLLVVAEQVNPSGSVPPVAIPDDGKSDNSGIGAAKMPANSPTLLENIWNFLTGRN